MRNRAEILLYTDSGYLVEQLGSPQYPESIGLLRCPGGKIELGEDPKATLYREFWEEYGLWLGLEVTWLSHSKGKRGHVIRYTAPAPACWAGRLDVEEGTSMLVLSDTMPSPWV